MRAALRRKLDDAAVFADETTLALVAKFFRGLTRFKTLPHIFQARIGQRDLDNFAVETDPAFARRPAIAAGFFGRPETLSAACATFRVRHFDDFAINTAPARLRRAANAPRFLFASVTLPAALAAFFRR